MSQKLSRREALKALAAVTGAAVLATVPTKWETPLIEIGAIPAHAQGSSNLRITRFVVKTRDCYYDATLDYIDALMQTGPDSTVGGAACKTNYLLSFGQINRPVRPRVYNGTLNYIIELDCCVNGAQITAQINASGILSNLFTTTAA